MTSLEKAERIVEQKNCRGISCESSIPSAKCPACDVCRKNGQVEPLKVRACADYIKSQEGNMDKQAAIKRLDAIEYEAKELRQIIEKGDKLEYDERKLYVGVYGGVPYILAGLDLGKYFRFHRFGGHSMTEQAYGHTIPTGHECLDFHINAGFKITAFDDTRKALEFFLENLGPADPDR